MGGTATASRQTVFMLGGTPTASPQTPLSHVRVVTASPKQSLCWWDPYGFPPNPPQSREGSHRFPQTVFMLGGPLRLPPKPPLVHARAVAVAPTPLVYARVVTVAPNPHSRCAP